MFSLNSLSVMFEIGFLPSPERFELECFVIVVVIIVSNNAFSRLFNFVSFKSNHKIIGRMREEEGIGKRTVQ